MTLPELLKSIRARLEAAQLMGTANYTPSAALVPEEAIYIHVPMLARAKPLHDHAPTDLAKLLAIVELQRAALKDIAAEAPLYCEGYPQYAAATLQACDKLAGGE